MSEFDWIARYFAPLAKRPGAAGLNDDVAQLSGAASMITNDALVEGVHFLPDDPIDTIARKLVRVNVSDVIAKGGLPDEVILTLGWPKHRSEEELAAFAEAFGQELSDWGASLIGGDTVKTPQDLFLTLTLTAKPAGSGAPVRREGARPGDEIWVSGKIGGGSLGLKDALANIQSRARDYYRVPDIPSLKLAELIANYASASMDVSDGLIGDTIKLLTASGCAGKIDLDRIPLFASVAERSDALDLCIGGDDYQCLFTASGAAASILEKFTPQLSRIGRIDAGTGLQLYWHGETIQLPERVAFIH